MPSPASHYFDEEPTSESDPRNVQLVLADVQLWLTTDRGVFGYGRIDAGTKVLLLKAPPPAAAGDLLDLGCGTGSMALTMARRSPNATVWAVDVNERARQLCQTNAERNAIENVRVCAPGEVPADVRFATIWSNPAIRIGKVALHEMLSHWFSRLDAGGQAVLVVHKHLGGDSLMAWLNAQGWPTTRAASSGGYRILRSSGRDPGG